MGGGERLRILIICWNEPQFMPNATTQQHGPPGAREIISIKTPPHPAERRERQRQGEEIRK